MTPQEFGQVIQIMWNLFTNPSRPAAPDGTGGSRDRAFHTYFYARYPAFQPLDQNEVVAALYALAERSKYEPSISEIRAQMRTNKGGWSEAWTRLSEAVSVHLATKRSNDKPATDWIEHDDGRVEVVTSGTERWRDVAGDDVVAWVDSNGGITRAAMNQGDSTYRAQFRDWWNDHQRQADEEAAGQAGVAAAAALRELVPPDLADVLPSGLPPAGQQGEIAPS